MSAGWSVVIGLECHAQLACASKMFCACPVGRDDAPNVAVCPICLAHPGTLPALNEQAVALALRAALALGCSVAETSVFARKHYFYPDLPKGYQISQDDRPLATGGALHLDGRPFRIARMHLEEDAGKMIHTPEGSFVDWNRAGIPLLEIVSDPDLGSPEDAEAWLRTLHRVLVEGGVCLGDLELGHFRCDANVSVSRPGEPWGTRVEVKNVNSFRFVARAIRYEIERQTALIEAGRPVERETRTWAGARTVSLRKKEEAADYRYFPEPDLPPLRVDPAELAAAAFSLPGVPLDLHLAERDAGRRADWCARYHLDEADVDALLGNPEGAALFVAAVDAGGAPRAVANLVRGEVFRRLNEEGTGRLDAGHLAAVATLLAEGRLTRDGARKILDAAAREGGDAAALVARLGERPLDDALALQDIVAQVVLAHPDELARYRAGNKGLHGFFIGQVMTATARRADPKLAARLVRAALEGGS